MRFISLAARGHGRIPLQGDIRSVVKHEVGEQKERGKVSGHDGMTVDVLKHREYITRKKLAKLFQGWPGL